MNFDRPSCYRAMRSRDRRFDGRFFVGVRTTGIYCRPVCPAPTPKFENVEFYACAAAAEDAGFRPCKRCRPETAPGTPAWVGSPAVVARGLRLIRAGALDDADVGNLAARLGVGARQLRRLFETHLGASPAAVARARRVHFARALLDQSDLSVTAVAFAAGFRSVRQFNHAVRATFRESPRALRRRRTAAPTAGEPLALRVAYRPPLDWEALLGFLALRLTPGVDAVRDGRYHRTVAVGDAVGSITVEPVAGEAALLLRVRLAECAGVQELVERVRRLFDLDADPREIGAQLARSPALHAQVVAAPGLRVPGAWDPFEIAMRAVIGQQISVRAATTLIGRLVAAFGARIDAGDGLTHLFPRADVLADADVAAIGLPRTRAATVRALAAAVAHGEPVLDAACSYETVVERLCAIRGVGPWTAQYIAMRGLGEPDAFPAGDLGVRKALGNGAGPLAPAAVERLAEAWRPWRAYAVMHLWNGSTLKEDI
jgi:AraC family transcriptional regulator, regulatory protein of adaptative response / DNA-3-methyladenine glycosylase II